ncbi:hypothetical protein KCU88_g273, partial [Aureobasidium melanogenum]
LPGPQAEGCRSTSPARNPEATVPNSLLSTSLVARTCLRSKAQPAILVCGEKSERWRCRADHGKISARECRFNHSAGPPVVVGMCEHIPGPETSYPRTVTEDDQELDVDIVGLCRIDRCLADGQPSVHCPRRIETADLTGSLRNPNCLLRSTSSKRIGCSACQAADPAPQERQCRWREEQP